jgi:hypothetical protein
MKIVINSHTKSNIALQHLLESIKENDIYCDIIVVIGGYYALNNYEIIEDKNITYIHANHNSIDFTGLITLMELYSDINEYYIYLHDTCKIGKNFYNKIKSIDLTGVTTIKIHKCYSMNIGVYSQEIINNFKKFLLSRKNTDENKCMEFKSNGFEDYIFKNDINNKLLDDYDGYHYTSPTNYYNTGTMRIIEYYPNLDLYKIKANWGQGYYTLHL